LAWSCWSSEACLSSRVWSVFVPCTPSLASVRVREWESERWESKRWESKRWESKRVNR
jgi:hypothetical protein